MNNLRYSWRQMSNDYYASYFNDKDYKEGKKFIVIDNKTGKKYIFPKIEKRKSDDNKIHDYNTLDSDLRNEEFIAWAICTSKDFIKHVNNSWLTKNVVEYIVSNYEYPEIFTNKWNNNLQSIMNQELWNKAFKRNNNIIKYIPNEYISEEMINSLKSIKNPPIDNIGYDKLTPSLFENMYFNSDNEYKLILIPPVPEYSFVNPVYDEQIKSLITKNIADDILSINIRTIWYIPERFISRENAVKAMIKDISLIKYVPSKYQTIRFQKKAIDERHDYIGLINPSVLSDEMIYYALSKKASSFKYIPESRLTQEICDYAIGLSGKVLEYVPDKFKNPRLCFKAIVRDPGAAKFVPVEYFTNEFVNALNEYDLDYPVKDRKYIEEAILSNKKSSKVNTYDIDSNYANIKLDSVKGLLSALPLKLLDSYNIKTVGDLINLSDNDDILKAILKYSEYPYEEIVGVIGLLRYKYLGIEPNIDFADTGDINKDMINFCTQIGLSSRSTSILCRNDISLKQLFNIMRRPDRAEVLHGYRNAGVAVVQEIILKTLIALDYYDEKQKREKDNNKERINELEKELNNINMQIQKLNTRANEITNELNENSEDMNISRTLK